MMKKILPGIAEFQYGITLIGFGMWLQQQATVEHRINTWALLGNVAICFFLKWYLKDRSSKVVEQVDPR